MSLEHGGVWQKVLTFTSPLHTLRLAATCRPFGNFFFSLDARRQYQAAVNFLEEDWVFIDDLNDTRYNKYFGQIVRRLNPHRFAVAVDNVLGPVMNCQGYAHPTNCRVVSLPAKNLSKVICSVLAVRLHAQAEQQETADKSTKSLHRLVPGTGNALISHVRLPVGLVRFSSGCTGDVPLMYAAGMPLSLRETQPRSNLGRPEGGGWQCYIATQLALVGHDEKDPASLPISMGWDDVGPHVVARLDGKDFCIEDLALVLGFVIFYRLYDWRGKDLTKSAVMNSWNHFHTQADLWTGHIEMIPETSSPTAGKVDFQDEIVPEGTPIAPEEAALTQHERWASHVEHVIAKGQYSESTRGEPAAECGLQSHVLLLTFHRNPAEFDAALLGSELADDLRVHGVDIQPSWAHGAKILAVGITEAMVAELPRSLGLRDVIIHESDEHRLWAALSGIPFDIRPRLKPGMGRIPLSLPGSVSMFGDTSVCQSQSANSDFGAGSSIPEEFDMPSNEIQVSRTFIHFQDAGAVTPRTTSDTQAVEIGNPRVWTSRGHS